MVIIHLSIKEDNFIIFKNNKDYSEAKHKLLNTGGLFWCKKSPLTSESCSKDYVYHIFYCHDIFPSALTIILYKQITDVKLSHTVIDIKQNMFEFYDYLNINLIDIAAELKLMIYKIY